mmetsp:Transcript_29005/g.39459  ORF Transcript_29005/g.39459 Transcript_29005/m.39459 type:complete len:119 (+) Transcript_29005:340-696(+)
MCESSDSNHLLLKSTRNSLADLRCSLQSKTAKSTSCWSKFPDSFHFFNAFFVFFETLSKFLQLLLLRLAYLMSVEIAQFKWLLLFSSLSIVSAVYSPLPMLPFVYDLRKTVLVCISFT